MDLKFFSCYNKNMFIKVTKSGKNRYAQVVRAFRENGKIKHEVLLNLGRTDYLSGNSGMQKMALKLMEIAGVKEVIDINRAEEAQIVKWGDIVYQKLWHETKIGDSLNPCKGRETTWFDFKKTCLYLLTRYLLTPEEDNYYFTADIPINQFYRTLDILGQNKDLIEDELFPGLEKLTQPVLEQTAGCVFKNPSHNMAAGQLLDKAGMRGRARKNACFSGRHANFLINMGGAESSEALDLINEATEKVRKKFEVNLELEIRVI